MFLVTSASRPQRSPIGDLPRGALRRKSRDNMFRLLCALELMIMGCGTHVGLRPLGGKERHSHALGFGTCSQVSSVGLRKRAEGVEYEP